MKQVKIGIIGVGNMGSAHLNNILSGKCPELQVSAVADINPARLQWVKETTGEASALFSDAEAMLDSGLVEAAIVAVPHYDHPATPLPAWREGSTSWWKSPRACTPSRCGR